MLFVLDPSTKKSIRIQIIYLFLRKVLVLQKITFSHRKLFFDMLFSLKGYAKSPLQYGEISLKY